MDIRVHYEGEAVTVRLSDDEITALAVANELSGPWIPPMLRQAREALYDQGLINSHCAITPLGRKALKGVDQWVIDELDATLIEEQFRELDRLDAACRRRPKQSRYDG